MRTGGALVPQRLSPGTPQRTCHGGHSVRLTLRTNRRPSGSSTRSLPPRRDTTTHGPSPTRSPRCTSCTCASCSRRLTRPQPLASAHQVADARAPRACARLPRKRSSHGARPDLREAAVACPPRAPPCPQSGRCLGLVQLLARQAQFGACQSISVVGLGDPRVIRAHLLGDDLADVREAIPAVAWSGSRGCTEAWPRVDPGNNRANYPAGSPGVLQVVLISLCYFLSYYGMGSVQIRSGRLRSCRQRVGPHHRKP